MRLAVVIGVIGFGVLAQVVDNGIASARECFPSKAEARSHYEGGWLSWRHRHGECYFVTGGRRKPPVVDTTWRADVRPPVRHFLVPHQDEYNDLMRWLDAIHARDVMEHPVKRKAAWR